MKYDSPFLLYVFIYFTMVTLTNCRSVTESTTGFEDLWLMSLSNDTNSTSTSILNSTTPEPVVIATASVSKKTSIVAVGRTTKVVDVALVTDDAAVAMPTDNVDDVTVHAFTADQFTGHNSSLTTEMEYSTTSESVVIQKTTKIVNKAGGGKINPALKAGVIAGVAGGVAIVVLVCAAWKFCCAKFFDNKQKIQPADFRNNENDGEEKVHAAVRKESWQQY